MGLLRLERNLCGRWNGEGESGGGEGSREHTSKHRTEVIDRKRYVTTQSIFKRAPQSITEIIGTRLPLVPKYYFHASGFSRHRDSPMLVK